MQTVNENRPVLHDPLPRVHYSSGEGHLTTLPLTPHLRSQSGPVAAVDPKSAALVAPLSPTGSSAKRATSTPPPAVRAGECAEGSQECESMLSAGPHLRLLPPRTTSPLFSRTAGARRGNASGCWLGRCTPSRCRCYVIASGSSCVEHDRRAEGRPPRPGAQRARCLPRSAGYANWQPPPGILRVAVAFKDSRKRISGPSCGRWHWKPRAARGVLIFQVWWRAHFIPSQKNPPVVASSQATDVPTPLLYARRIP